MNLDRISAVVRPRNAWEASDLGILMAKQWWGTLMKTWLITIVPPFVLLQLLCFQMPILGFFLFWWFKPIWEMGLLYILSRALFGEIPSLKETLRAYPSLFKQDGLMWATFRRFNPHRAFDMPVGQLEKLKGSPRGKRLSVLHRVGSSAPLGVTFLFLALEFMFSLGLVALLYIFLPKSYNLDLAILLDADPILQQWFYVLPWFFATCLIGPFHVAAGFSVYLNRRTILEGWDIELIFRRLAKRHEEQSSSYGAQIRKGMLLLFLCGGGFFWTQDSLAQEVSQFKSEQQEIKENIKKVLDQKEFHKIQIEKYPKALDDLTKEKMIKPRDPILLPDFIMQFFVWIGQSFQIILAFLFVSFILFLLYRYRDWLGGWERKKKQAPPKIETLFGFDLREQSLPNDIPSEVIALWKAGKTRLALSLLYRATLTHLINQYGFEFHDGYTEMECVHLVKKTQKQELSQYFFTLTLNWQKLAYGHQLPEFQIVESLCSEWSQFFVRDAATS